MRLFFLLGEGLGFSKWNKKETERSTRVFLWKVNYLEITDGNQTAVCSCKGFP